jgi:hypothetical protein
MRRIINWASVLYSCGILQEVTVPSRTTTVLPGIKPINGIRTRAKLHASTARLTSELVRTMCGRAVLPNRAIDYPVAAGRLDRRMMGLAGRRRVRRALTAMVHRVN